MRTLRDFKNDRTGIFWVVSVSIITLIIVTAMWFVLMIVTSRFVDIFGAMATNPNVPQLGDTTKIMGTITIIVIWVGMFVYMITSAFKKESQEDDLGLMG